MTVGRYCKWKELHKRKLQKISRLKWSISFPQFAIRDEISFLGSNAFKKIVSWGVEKNQSEIKEVSEEQLKLRQLNYMLGKSSSWSRTWSIFMMNFMRFYFQFCLKLRLWALRHYSFKTFYCALCCNFFPSTFMNRRIVLYACFEPETHCNHRHQSLYLSLHSMCKINLLRKNRNQDFPN